MNKQEKAKFKKLLNKTGGEVLLGLLQLKPGERLSLNMDEGDRVFERVDKPKEAAA